MTSDAELLRQYADARSEAAFAELVRRQVDLVYATALRLTAGDAHLAEDIAQTVFRDLAAKAGQLRHHQSLAGWLHTSARFAASKAVRTERRRRLREQENSAMTNPSAEPEIPWAQVRPVLDEAVGALEQTDREAVLMRFFANKTHGEIGAVLGLSDNAARMKTERALEKLRTLLARRGVTSTAVLLGGTLSAHAMPAAPTGLAGSLAGTVLADLPAAGGLIAPAIFMTTNTKLLATALTVAAVMAIPLAYQLQDNARLREQLTQTQALQAAQLARASDRLLALERALVEREAAQRDELRQQSHGEAALAPSQATPGGPPVPSADFTLEAVKAALVRSSGRDEVFDAATTGYVRAWVAEQPESVVAWLNSLPEERKQREHAIEAMMNMVVDVSPATAFAFVSGISDDAVRQSRLLDVVRKWAAADPRGAVAYVKAANLDEEERGRLLRAMEKVAVN